MKTNEVNTNRSEPNPHDRKQVKVTVENLSNECSSLYMNITPINALINEHLLNSSKASQLHNPVERERAKSLIISGNKTFSIGDLCVLKFG